MNPSFNLIDQDWIPCLTVDNKLKEFTLYDMLVNAHDLKAICCETPIISAAIMPMMLALLHRVFGPAGQRDWQALWNQGTFPKQPLNDYFSQWHDRFDLFHPERPFYQVKDGRVKPKSVIHLIHSIGNTGTLFTHATDTKGLRLSPATAARYLITDRYFRTAGLSGLDEKFTDSPFTRGVLFYAEGANIFETLLLNLVKYPDEYIMLHTDADKPVWENDSPFDRRNTPYGYLDYLTWPSNRVWLIPESDKRGEVYVQYMTVAPGLNLDAEVKSPQKQYIQREKKGETTWSFLYFNSSRALWRDYHSLLMLNTKDIEPPAVVEWLSELALDGMIEDDQDLKLTAIGMLADQAKPIFYRQEPMPLPATLLSERTDRQFVFQAIKDAEGMADTLRNTLNTLADEVLMRGSERKPDSKDRGDLIQQWDVISSYWAELEIHFWEFIDTLTSANPEEALVAWHNALTRTARHSLGQAIQMAGASPWAMKGGASAERILNAGIRKLFNEGKSS